MSDFLECGVLRYRFYVYRDPAGGDASAGEQRLFSCPCCDYPTIHEPAGYGICPLCSWEDDGHDGFGPNACSLDKARANFRQFLTCYSADHQCAPDYPHPGEQHFIHEYELQPENLAAKRQTMQHLDALMAESDPDERGRILARAFPSEPEEPLPVYHPAPDPITVLADRDGWTRCPTCNFRFSARNAYSISEGRHLRCGQLLNVVFLESHSA